jgi:hypothetical protein
MKRHATTLCVLMLLASCQTTDRATADGSATAPHDDAPSPCPAGDVLCGTAYCIPADAECCTGTPGRYCPPGGLGCSSDGQFCTEPCSAASVPFSTGCSTGGLTCTTNVGSGCCYNDSVCCDSPSSGPACAAQGNCVAVASGMACANGQTLVATPAIGGGGGGGGGGGSTKHSGCSAGGESGFAALLVLLGLIGRGRATGRRSVRPIRA